MGLLKVCADLCGSLILCSITAVIFCVAVAITISIIRALIDIFI